MENVVERVTDLEIALERFMVHTERSLNRLSKEMIDFKFEIKEDRKYMNKRWGDLANKMGTLVEDIVAPAVRPMIKRYFDKEITDFSVARRRKAGNLEGEFDVIAVCDDTVFLVEVKSKPKEQHLAEFQDNIIKFKELFPEYNNKKLIPVFASLRFEDELIRKATKNNIYVMAYREWDYMDLLNHPIQNL